MDSTELRRVSQRDELTEIRQSIDHVLTGQFVKTCLFNLYGITGIGKTTLLNALAQHYRTAPPAQDACIVMIDFSRPTCASEASLPELAQYVWQQLLAIAPPHLHQAPDDQEATEHAIARFIDWFATTNRRLLLLIDAWDTRPAEFRHWCEEALLLPLIQHERLVAVLTSQTPLRLRTYTVRRRMQSTGLGCLSRAATFAQVEHDDATNTLIFELTGGYPAAIGIVLDALRHIAPPREPWLRDHAGALAHQIGAMLEQTLCGHLPPHIARLLAHLALFREFDIHTIRYITRVFLTDLIDYGASSLAQELNHTGAIHWNNDLRAYQIDDAIRPLIARDTAHNAPDTHRRIHLAAVKYYQELIGEVPSHRVTYLIEYIYHRLCLDTASTLQYSNVQQEFTDFLEEHYPSQHITRRELHALHELQQRIEQDDEIHAQLARYQIAVATLTEPITQRLAAAHVSSTEHDT